jgi:hypothetical protein
VEIDYILVGSLACRRRSSVFGQTSMAQTLIFLPQYVCAE